MHRDDPHDLSLEANRFADLVQDLRGNVQRLGVDEHTAEDVVQETLLRGVERPPVAGNLRGWMRIVASRIVFQLRSSQRNREQRERRVARGLLVDARCDALEESLIERWLDELPDPYREVVRLRYVEDRQIAEIARLLGCPETTVRSQLKRGLDRLRSRLGEDGKRRSSWASILLFLSRARSPRVVWGACACGVLCFLGWFRWWTDSDQPRSAVALDRAVAAASSFESSVALPPESRSRLPLPPAEATRADVRDERRLAGRVLDPQGQPVAGAEVHVTRADDSGETRVVRTDPAGRYELVLSADSGLLWATSSAWCSSTRRAIVTVTDHEACDLFLLEKDGHGLVEVRSPDGRAVEGASVSLERAILERSDSARMSIDGTLEFPPDRIRSVTDRSGHAELPLPAAKELLLRISSPGHPAWSGELDAGSLREGVTIVLARAAGIGGTVVDAAGVPLADARVEALQQDDSVFRSTRSAFDGSFSIDDLSPGLVRMRAWDETSGAWDSTLAEIEVQEGGRARVELRLDGDHTIQGRVLDAPAGATVQLAPFERKFGAARTSAVRSDGSFAFPGCTRGLEHRLDLFPASGTLPVATLQNVLPGTSENLLVPLPRALRLHSLELEFVGARMPTLVELRGARGSFLTAVDPLRRGAAIDDVPSIDFEAFAWFPGLGSWKLDDLGVGHGQRKLQAAVPETGRVLLEVDGLDGTSLVDVDAYVIVPSLGAYSFGDLGRPECDKELVLNGAGLFEAELFPREYRYFVRHRNRDAKGTVRVEAGVLVRERVVLGTCTDVLLVLTCPRPLQYREVLTLEARTADGTKRFCGRVKQTDPVLVRLPLDATELLVSSEKGMAGSSILPVLEARPAGAEQRLELVLREP